MNNNYYNDFDIDDYYKNSRYYKEKYEVYYSKRFIPLRKYRDSYCLVIPPEYMDQEVFLSDYVDFRHLLTGAVHSFERELLHINSYIDIYDIINKLYIPPDLKFVFLINCILSFSNSPLKNKILPSALNEHMEKYEDKIISILQKNKSVLMDFIECYKKVPLLLSIHEQLYKKIFELEGFKTMYLRSDNFDPDYEDDFFYEILPHDCGYLIGYFDAAFYVDSYFLLDRYHQYFGDILTKEEIDEFVNYQFSIDHNNVFELPVKERNRAIFDCLKKFKVDKNGVLEFRILRDKCHLDLKSAINFISKYGNTKIYRSLFSSYDFSDDLFSDDFSDDLLNKIKYLAQESVIENIDTISDLSTVTRSELSSMPKANSSVKPTLRGGPDAFTNSYAFNDGHVREIRRIDYDGAYSVELISSVGTGHDAATQRIYFDTPEVYFNDELFATERAVLAVEKISSITFIIENELCCIIMPSNLSIEQITLLKHLFADLTDTAKVAIMRYDPDRDITIYENDGDTMNKSEVLRFIENYEENIFSKMVGSNTL